MRFNKTTMASTFAGFSEEDLKRIKFGETDVNSEAISKINLRRIERNALKSRRIANKLPTLTNQISDELDVDTFEKCKLSLKTPPSPTDVVNNNSLNMSSDHKNGNNENTGDIERKTSTHIAPDVVRCMDSYTEGELETHKVKLEELQLRQKLMEEQNKKRKEMLAKALADRTKQTEEEVQKLEKIKKELQVLDGQFSQDVAVLRKKIDQACISYSEAEKNYLKVEKEFLQAKINLQKEKEKKELLTEHLCALITHNETRKAQKLETLMLELANDKNKAIFSNMTDSVASIENNTLDITSIDDKPVIIDGVDERTGKMVEMFDEN